MDPVEGGIPRFAGGGMKKVFTSFTLETKTFGLNPRITPHGNQYDKIVACGSFYIDPLPAVGMDNARFTIKAPTGERKRVQTIDAAHKAIEAWAIDAAAGLSSLSGTDSALVAWRIKNYCPGTGAIARSGDAVA
jgi:hypothetical protein